jgi:hypothetical protein
LHGVDASRPSCARMYDYALGGKDNYAIDRETVERIFGAFPDMGRLVLANRAFLVRAVRYIAEQGVRQFIDLGAGIPTSPNVHEVAQEVHPDASVVYVDHDPVVVSHSRALRAKQGSVIVVEADIRRPNDVFDHAGVREIIDFDQPVGLLFISILQFVPDADDPAGIVARFRDNVVSGSYLALSIASIDGVNPESAEKVISEYRDVTVSITPRKRGEIESFFEGFELEPPGLVNATRWRTDGPDIPGGLAAVARKP